MVGRIAAGGVLAGLVVFIWGALSHMLLGLGEIGISKLPNEEAVIGTLAANVHASGFYFLPWIEESEMNDQAKVSEWENKLKNGPSGIMVCRPNGGEGMTPGQLFREYAGGTMWCLIAACLLSVAAPRLPHFGMRVLFVASMGLIAGLDIYVSYWNWYGFPSNYTAAAMLDEVIGFALAGGVIAAIIRPPAAATEASASSH